MIKNKKFMIPLVIVFSFTELVLFFFVQLTTGKEWESVAYASVVLACVFMLTSFSKTKNYLFMQIGLVLTVFADWFLVVEDPIQELPAMIFFSGTQICYFLRIFSNHKTEKQKCVHLVVRAALSMLAIAIAVIILGEDADAVSLVSMFYYANLILNVVFAFLQREASLIFPIGLLLFLMCDTVVGLNALSGYVHIENASALNSILFGKINWAWVFYLPSQTLIALSLTEFKIEEKKEAF